MINKLMSESSEENQPSLYMISSPLHLLCAVEAKLTLESDSLIDIFVLYTLCENNNNQINQLLSKYSGLWRHVFSLKMRKTRTFIHGLEYLRSIVKLAKGMHQYKRVFISDPRVESLQILASLLKYKELVVSDDGLATISIFTDFCMTGQVFTTTKKVSYLKKIVYWWSGIKIKEPQSVSFYSLFSMNSNSKTHAIYNCDFRGLKKLHQIGQYSSCGIKKHFFIGQKLVDAKIVTDSKYIEFIEDYINNLQCDELIYIPHRGESNGVLQRLELINKLIIQQVDKPIELYFLENCQTPCSIASFYSTALITLSMLVENVNISSIALKQSDLLNEEKFPLVEDVYKFISSYTAVSLLAESER